MKAAYMTLGCKVSQYETQAVRTAMEARGYETVPFDALADVYVVNSCTVTATADQKSRQMVHRARRLSPDALVVLCGCFPQASKDAAAAVTDADIVAGTTDRAALPDLIDRALKTRERAVSVKQDIRHETYEEMTVDGLAEHTRAFVKIEDGCDRFCTYCMVPYARGNVRSRPLEAIVSEVKRLAANGYREVVLTGINLSAYGKNEGLSLADAVDAAASVEGVRVRLSSLEPDFITQDMIERFAKEPALCRQFHVALQSGSDTVLQRMGRKYTAAEYADLVARIRDAMPDAAFTTDLMVGFPGETAEEFEETLSFVRRIGFASAHVFVYSPRRGTPAASMPGQIDADTGRRRSKMLSAVVDETRDACRRALDGTTAEVLALSNDPDGEHTLGMTGNGAGVLLPLGAAGLFTATLHYRDGFLYGEPSDGL